VAIGFMAVRRFFDGGEGMDAPDLMPRGLRFLAQYGDRLQPGRQGWMYRGARANAAVFNPRAFNPRAFHLRKRVATNRALPLLITTSRSSDPSILSIIRHRIRGLGWTYRGHPGAIP
jgi:hypothetical protein